MMSVVCMAVDGWGQALHIESGALFHIQHPAAVNGLVDLLPSVYVDGSVMNLGTLQNNGELHFTGNLSSPGLYNSTGDDVFKGTGSQLFSGNFVGVGGFYNLILDNSAAAQITANSPANVSNSINLVSGILSTNGQIVHLLNTSGAALSGSAVAGDNHRFVHGNLRQSVSAGNAYSFEVGSLLHGNQPATFTLVNTGSATFMDVGYSEAGAGSITPVNIPSGCIGTYDKAGGTWTAIANGVNGTYNYSLTVNPGGLNTAALSGSLYDALEKDGTFLTNACDGGFGNYTATDLNSFSTIRLIGGATSALPIMLGSFSGRKAAAADVLEWTTLSEKNSAGFNLSYSRDGITFIPLAKVNSQAPNGTSEALLSYAAINNSPMPGHNYYRLEQVDIDGRRSMVGHVVDLFRDGLGIGSLSLYPNPAHGHVRVDLFSAENTGGVLLVTDLTGRVLKRQPLTGWKGSQFVDLNLQGLASGLYVLQVHVNGSQNLSQRFEVLQ